MNLQTGLTGPPRRLLPLLLSRTSYARHRRALGHRTPPTTREDRSLSFSSCYSRPASSSSSSTMSDLPLRIGKPQCLLQAMDIPSRLLMGPGPSNASERVLQAMTKPLLGHLHPEFLKIMDDVKEGLGYLFQTESRYVFCVSGTGHAGMESIMTNLLDKEHVILVARNGIWGDRAANMAARQDGDIRFLEKPPGEVFSLEEVEEGLRTHRPAVFFVVHAESSTGALQPLEGIGPLCKKYGSLFVVDTVASLGGVPFYMDDWGVDVVYTGSQKVLSCPPSLAPIALSETAMEKVKSRKSLPKSYYFDFIELANYWGCDDQPRRYHHTGPISSVYALRESLAYLTEEGLESFWSRHAECAKYLHEGLQKQGLELFISNSKLRAPTVTTIKVPKCVHWKMVTDHLLQNSNIEMGGGLGPTAGKVWRIGLLGENCTFENVDTILEILHETFQEKNLFKSNL